MNILYEDAALVVLDKPAGLSSEEGVPAALRQLWSQPDAFVGVVHRLDTGVTTIDLRYFEGDLLDTIAGLEPDIALTLYTASTTRLDNLFQYEHTEE